MTLLRPGQRPPQVTMAARVFRGSKKIFCRGPAFSKDSSHIFFAGDELRFVHEAIAVGEKVADIVAFDE